MSTVSRERGQAALDAMAYPTKCPECAAPLPPNATHCAMCGWAPSLAKRAHQSIVLTGADSVTVKPIDWLWEGYLPRGMMALLAGLPGCGKSTLALAITATITNAGRWPDGTPMNNPGSVLIWSSEDAMDTTLVPRLMAMNADLSRVKFVTGFLDAEGNRRAFDPSQDIRALEEQAALIPDLRLLIVDPVLSAVAGDSHKAAETRRGLQAVVDMASARNIAVLGITHFRKGSSATDPAERVIGSQAFVALARMVLVASKVKDPEGGKLTRIIARAKSNISADDGGFEFFLEQYEVKPGIWAQGVQWGGAISGSALALLNQAENTDGTNDERHVIDEAVEFLQNALASGQVQSKEVEADAKAAGISVATLRRAKKQAKVKSVKSAMQGCWMLELRRCSPNSEDAHPFVVSTFEQVEHLRAESTETELEF